MRRRATPSLGDPAARLANKAQLTEHGDKVYLEAVEEAFGTLSTTFMLLKMYEGDSGKNASADVRYSLAQRTEARTRRITGDPDPAHISTRYAGRANRRCGWGCGGLPG